MKIENESKNVIQYKAQLQQIMEGKIDFRHTASEQENRNPGIFHFDIVESDDFL